MANVEEVRISDTTEERGREPVPTHGKKKRDHSKAREVAALEQVVGDFGIRLEKVEYHFKTLEEHVIGEFEGVKDECDKIKDEHQAIEDRLDQFEEKIMNMLEAMREDLALCKRAAACGEAATSASSPRVEVPRPACFKGVRDAKEVENFLWQMEQYFENLGLTDEAKKIKAATPYLTDTAMLWWRRKHADIERGTCRIDTWDDFKRELKRHFYPENVVYEARRRLRELKQRGSIRDYVQEFTTLVLQIPNLSEEDLLFYFIDGLQQWAKQEVQRRNVRSVDEAIVVAESLTDFRSQCHFNPSKRRDTSPTIGRGERHHDRERDNPRKSPTRNGDKDAARREYEEKKKAFVSKLACYICKEPHYMRDCPKLGSLSAMVEQHEAKTDEEDETNRMGSLQILTALNAKTMPTTSNKGLMYVEALVNGKPTQALVDTGATHNFMTEDEARRLGLRWTKGEGWLKAANARAQPLNGVARGVELRLGTWKGQVNFSVAPMDDYKVVLGMDFFRQATAIPMPSFNTICILEKGSSCMIPTYEAPERRVKGSQQLSTMQIVEGAKNGEDNVVTNACVDKKWRPQEYKSHHETVENQSRGLSRRAPLVATKSFNQGIGKVLTSKVVRKRGVPRQMHYLIKLKGLLEEDLWKFQDFWRHTRRRGRRRIRWGRM